MLLSEGKPARAAELSEAEEESLKGLMLLTMKKVRKSIVLCGRRICYPPGDVSTHTYGWHCLPQAPVS